MLRRIEKDIACSERACIGPVTNGNAAWTIKQLSFALVALTPEISTAVFAGRYQPPAGTKQFAHDVTLAPYERKLIRFQAELPGTPLYAVVIVAGKGYEN
ncbi:MAG: hypothetical protein FJX52_08550 [Alphaproteobacteria bacterium]|nr:hypothetical protein [Alphaproteobacteria bacterium]